MTVSVIKTETYEGSDIQINVEARVAVGSHIWTVRSSDLSVWGGAFPNYSWAEWETLVESIAKARQKLAEMEQG